MPVPGDTPSISDHPAHPEHELKRVANDDCQFFMCDGCMEPGAGTRYRCDHDGCSFDLHACCAAVPETFTHPLFGDRVFLFLLKPPATITTRGKCGRTCVICDKEVRGFVYHCFNDDDDDGPDLHPCCLAHLPQNDLWDGPIFVLGKETWLSGSRDISGDDKRRIEIRRSAAPPARHRQLGLGAAGAGRQAGGRDLVPPESTQLNSHALHLRQGDMSDNRNGRRQRREPGAARHRCWWRPLSSRQVRTDQASTVEVARGP